MSKQDTAKPSGLSGALAAALQLTLPFFEIIAPNLAKPSSQSSPLSAEKKRSVVGTAGQLISFDLRRGKRKTIGFLIDDRGLTVSAPRWVPLAEIDAAVLEKSQWIARKHVEWNDHKKRRSENEIQWIDGGILQYLGQPIAMKIDPDQSRTTLVDNVLMVGLPSDANATRLRDMVQAWLQKQARIVFAQRFERLAMLTGKAPKRWRLSSARTRWGSCTSDGTVAINWRLMHFPIDVIDYVIAHEIAHLSEMNHGPQFWQTVEHLFPEYEKAKSILSNYPDDFGFA